jgi:DNA polymerase III epsilon subunit family exonuclease
MAIPENASQFLDPRQAPLADANVDPLAATIDQPPPHDGGKTLDGTEFTVIDVETTGRGRCPPERIIEVAVVRLDLEGRIRAEFDTLMQPDRPVTGTWVHSITDRLLNNAPRFTDVAGELAALLEGAVVVGHNVDFDLGFLRAEFAMAGLALPAVPLVCTLDLTRRLCPGLDGYRLVDCCREFRIERGRGHAALHDTRAAAELLRRLLEVARARGLTTLEAIGGRPGVPLPVGWGLWPRTGRALRRDDVQPLVLAKPVALLTASGEHLAGPAASTDAGVEFERQAQALLVGLAGPEAVLRDDQRTAIRALTVQRRRVLVVQRTGWGKSAVYFIATRLLRDAGHGPTLLISPLLALMRDQLAAATRIGIRAATLNSTNLSDWRGIERAVADGEIDLLLVSPERLANPRFQAEVLPALADTVALLVIDEAHCISDWLRRESRFQRVNRTSSGPRTKGRRRSLPPRYGRCGSRSVPRPVPTLACVAGNGDVRSPGPKPKETPSHRAEPGEGKAGRMSVSEPLMRLRQYEPSNDG